jgi:hypothetical protein
MSSRVAKWVFVLVAGVALSALGAAPQPGPSPHIVLEQPPQLDAITGLADTEALLLNAAGTKGYIVHVGRDDNAFITEFTVPNTKGGQCELGVLKGPRGSHAAAYDEANARLWVGNFPEGNVSVVDVSQPLKEKCVVTGTVAINDSATDVVYDSGRKQAYVSGLMTNSVYVLARKEGEKEEYELKATVDLSEACLGPNAIALGADALYVACMFTNNVVRVNLGTLKQMAPFQQAKNLLTPSFTGASSTWLQPAPIPSRSLIRLPGNHSTRYLSLAYKPLIPTRAMWPSHPMGDWSTSLALPIKV